MFPRLGIFLYLIMLSHLFFAQNLVPNNSFENAWSCPYSFVTTPIAKPYPNWINPNRGTPDLLHVCSTLDAGVPDNFAGSMYPNEGAAYAGIILRESFGDNKRKENATSREYIQTELSSPLRSDKLYCAKLFYANSSKSMYAVDALGITLTREKINTKNAEQIIQMPQIINKPEHIMSNNDYWEELCGVYRAKGNEIYLTIGNFWDNSQTNYLQNTHETVDSSFSFAYYYIDNVKVFEIENTFECGCLNNLSYGSDYLADNYNPETGYNDLDISNNNHDSNNQLASNFDNETANNSNNQNKNNSNSDNNNSSNDNTDNSNKFDTNNNNGILEKANKFGITEKSEININAFENLNIGDKFKLNKIFFEFNSSELIAVSFVELDRLHEILTNKPNLHIEIHGHTDNIGKTSYNNKLSENRAKAVYEYLIKKGINKTKIKYKGFGSSVPIADNNTEIGRQLNRRVEIVISEF